MTSGVLSINGILETILISLTFLFIHARFFPRRRRGAEGSQEAPEVSGAWPILGHVAHLAKDPHSFIADCFKKYGKLFTIRLGKRKLTLMCDRDLLPELFMADESTLSFYNFVAMTTFNVAFSETMTNSVAVAKPFIKLAFSRMTEVLTHGNEHIQASVLGLKDPKFQKPGLTMDRMLRESFYHAVFKVMTGLELSPDIFSIFNAFHKAVVRSAFASFVVPEWFLNYFFVSKTRALRKQYVQLLLPTVQKYIDDKDENTCSVVRHAVEYTSENLGRKLTPVEICEVIMAMQFTMTATPSTLCSHVLKEFSRRPDLWVKVRQELDPQVVGVAEIIRNKTLNAIVTEAARINSNITVLARRTFPHSYIGNYYLGNVDVLWVPGALLLEKDEAGSVFSNPGSYNPERFLKEEQKEPMDPRSIWLWGAGVHACPGRNISVNITKVFLAHFVQHFDLEVKSTQERNYLTLNTLALQHMNIAITPVSSSH